MEEQIARKLELTNKLLISNFGIKIKTVHYPYSTYTDVDLNFRKIIWPYLNDQQELSISKRLNVIEESQIFLAKSLIGYQNIAFRLPARLSDSILLIGPFLTNKHSEQAIIEIIKKNRFPRQSQDIIRNYFNQLPCVNVSKLLHNVQLLLENLVEKEVPILFYDFSNDRLKEINYNPEVFDFFAKEYLEDFAEKKRSLLINLKKGKTHEAIKSFQILENLQSQYEEESASKWKRSLFELLIRCEDTLLEKHVPYGLIKKSSTQFEYKIQRCHNRSEFGAIADEIIAECCRMVNINDYSNNSFIIRRALQICQNMLNEPTSLSTIAKIININSSVLSNQFKQEMGLTLTQYIQQEKMNLAKRLLRESKMSIRAIAEEISYFDYSYFSKVYKKIHGISPVQTRKEVIKDKD
ncbi:AraC family transcriptional regulator [Aquibacillus saliphilus]|uniref:AraC family transcriptional regulator n=1 Tax=Aquibacillus saliphilus TaxID=1909422 RepID=UPI001CEFEA45